MSTTALSTGLSAVRAEIERACREASRDPAGVTLVAVSKTFDADAIEPVIAAGQRCSAKTACRRPRRNGRR